MPYTYMARPEKYQIIKRIAPEHLNGEADLFVAGEDLTVAKARAFERNLMFVRMRYRGFTVAEASAASGMTEPTAYEVQRRWNESGFAGLVPGYTGGPKARLTEGQKAKIRSALELQPMDTRSVRLLIKHDYGVDYTEKQVHIILKRLGLHHAKPYPGDHRRPDDAEARLKKTSAMLWMV